MDEEPPKKRGRKSKSFQDCGPTQKYEKAAKLAESVNYDIEFLEYALKLAKHYHKIKPEKESCKCDKLPLSHTPESGLAHYIDMGYSRSKYELFKRDQRAMNCGNVYPSYRKLTAAKIECSIPFDRATETEVVFGLQQMLNKTVERLVKGLGISGESNIILYASSGFDSASGFKNPNQRSEEHDEQPSNSFQSLFYTGVTVFALVSDDKRLLWLSPSSNSTRWNRGVRFSHEKEDLAATVKERDRVLKSINELQPWTFVEGDTQITVNYNVQLTQLDGKCVNNCTGNKDTQKCPICLVRQNNFRSAKSFIPNEAFYKYGLGLLHCHIKAFGLCLALSYRINITGWSVKKHERQGSF